MKNLWLLLNKYFIAKYKGELLVISSRCNSAYHAAKELGFNGKKMQINTLNIGWLHTKPTFKMLVVPSQTCNDPMQVMAQPVTLKLSDKEKAEVKSIYDLRRLIDKQSDRELCEAVFDKQEAVNPVLVTRVVIALSFSLSPMICESDIKWLDEYQDAADNYLYLQEYRGRINCVTPESAQALQDIGLAAKEEQIAYGEVMKNAIGESILFGTKNDNINLIKEEGLPSFFMMKGNNTKKAKSALIGKRLYADESGYVLFEAELYRTDYRNTFILAPTKALKLVKFNPRPAASWY